MVSRARSSTRAVTTKGWSVDADLRQLRHFVAVAEQLHFGRAAQSLGIARTTLSRTVIELEAMLEVRLFVPGAQPTELTQAGHELLREARARIVEDERQRAEHAAAPTTFTVAFAAGVTLSKWTRIWSERVPDVELKMLATTAAEQIQVLHDGRAQVSFVRLPVDRTDLQLIPLYAETPVVVVPKDHAVSLFEHVSVLDLADERLLQDPEDVPEWQAVHTGSTTSIVPTGTMESVFELVAAGVGIVIVPQSIARLHNRRDLVYRPVTDVAPSQIGVAWLSSATSEHIETFIGIVQGRTANSSRVPKSTPPSTSTPSPSSQHQRGSTRGGTRKPSRRRGR